MARRQYKRRPGWRKPDLAVAQILAWADALHRRTGRWPRAGMAPNVISGSLGEKWSTVDDALKRGSRGLPGGGSLPRLLAEHRGVRNVGMLPRLTLRQILKWAGAYRQRTGRWPACRSPQVIDGSSGETWLNVDQALRRGLRGLPGGSSLAMLLAGRKSA